jgi:hypothetical protein
VSYPGPDDQESQQRHPQYGQPGPYQQQYPSAPPPGYGGYPPPARSNGLAIAALVCGLVGLLIFWFILGPLAVIFGGVGLSRAKRGAPGRGMAIAGIALGIADIVVYVILLAVLIHDHRFVI